MQHNEKTMARLRPGCICKGVRLIRLIETIEAGAESFKEVALKTGIGDGPCNGERCGRKVAELLAEHGK
jgi:bacterioferritin-associated ferredoxin